MSCLAMNSYSPADRTVALGNDRPPRCEEDLVADAKSGHSEAFEELCRRHAEQVIRVTRRITRNREDAEDVLQESFLSAFVHIRDFDGRSRFATWLTRIAINSALMLLRAKRSSSMVSLERASDPPGAEPWLQVADRAPDPELRCLMNERLSAVRVAIQALRPRAQRVIELGYLQEHSVEETAEMLGISVSAAKARASHARARLRKSPQLKRLRPAGANKHALLIAGDERQETGELICAQ